MNQGPKDLSDIHSVHLIAICGTGMGALAGILHQSGFKVTGSDQNIYPPMSTQLANLGIEVMPGYKPENLVIHPDMVIIGNAIRRDNPEARAAIDGGIPYISFPTALRRFYLSKKRTIAVCGTHGKTTTTALLAHLFTSAKRDPSFLVGGVMKNFGVGFQTGQGEDFIIEGDEYDTAFFDKVPKFVRYQPDWAIAANIEFDHADIYDSLDQIMDAFVSLASNIPQNGILFAGVDCPNVQKIIKHSSAPIVTFGLDESADYHPGKWFIENGIMNFDVVEKGESIPLQCSLAGEHNLKNLLAAIAVCRKAGIEFDEIRQGLLTFEGIKRRQEVRGEVNDILVIDDFAHHPTAVDVTLKALKKVYADRRLTAVFEPRTNTSRRKFFQDRYAQSFQAADKVYIAPVHDREAIDPGMRFDPGKLAEALSQNGRYAKSYNELDELLENLIEGARPGDVVVMMSNGGFGNLHQRFLDALEQRFGVVR